MATNNTRRVPGATRLAPHSETVCNGHTAVGTIHVKPKGAEAYGARGEYVATFPSLRDARKALLQLHRGSEQGLLA